MNFWFKKLMYFLDNYHIYLHPHAVDKRPLMTACGADAPMGPGRGERREMIKPA